MTTELDSRRDGSPVELHLHNHVPAPPTKDMVVQTVKETMSRVGDDWPPRRRRRRPQPRGRIGSFVAKLAVIVWDAVGLGVFGLLNVLVLSQGLVEISPSLFGAKISTVPGLSFMAGYLVWNKVLIGHVIAVGFFACMAFAWKILVRDLLLARGNEITNDDSEWNVHNTRLFWRISCGVMMSMDAILFYFGVTQSNLWTGRPHYFTAFLATILYLSVAAAYSAISLYLHDWERSE